MSSPEKCYRLENAEGCCSARSYDTHPLRRQQVSVKVPFVENESFKRFVIDMVCELTSSH